MRPMLRVQAIAEIDATPRPMRPLPGTSETRVEVVTAASPVGTVPPINPITMARMNRLFGVTMAERGVSQLVSVSLEAAETIREAS